MKNILFAMLVCLFGGIMAACQSCRKTDDNPAQPFVTTYEVFEDDASFQLKPQNQFTTPEQAALVVYKADAPVEVFINGTATTVHQTPDTIFLGAGDEIYYHPHGFADVRWLRVL